jgi:hypothetical protein
MIDNQSYILSNNETYIQQKVKSLSSKRSIEKLPTMGALLNW